MVLAGRFDDDEVPEIRTLVAEHGGRVVSDVDESRPHSWTPHKTLETEAERNPDQNPLA